MFCPLTLMLSSLQVCVLRHNWVCLLSRFIAKQRCQQHQHQLNWTEVHTSRSTVIVSQNIYRQNSHRLSEWETAWNHQDVLINDLTAPVSEASHISTSQKDIRAARMFRLRKKTNSGSRMFRFMRLCPVICFLLRFCAQKWPFFTLPSICKWTVLWLAALFACEMSNNTIKFVVVMISEQAIFAVSFQ